MVCRTKKLMRTYAYVLTEQKTHYVFHQLYLNRSVRFSNVSKVNSMQKKTKQLYDMQF